MQLNSAYVTKHLLFASPQSLPHPCITVTWDHIIVCIICHHYVSYH